MTNGSQLNKKKDKETAQYWFKEINGRYKLCHATSVLCLNHLLPNLYANEANNGHLI